MSLAGTYGFSRRNQPERIEAFANFSSQVFSYTDFANSTSSVSAVTIAPGSSYALYSIHVSNFNATTPFRLRIEHYDGATTKVIAVVAGSRNGPFFLTLENPIIFEYADGGFVKLIAESIDTTPALQIGNFINLIGVIV